MREKAGPRKASPRKASPEHHVRDFVRSCVRAGLLDDQGLYDEVVLAVSTELPDRADEADAVARDWIAGYRQELAREQASWPQVTDHDRLQDAFAELEGDDVVVLQGCEDHWAAKSVLEARAAAGDPQRGIAWFTPPDVWHAIDEGMLEVNLWHGSTANVAPGDELLDHTLAVFQRHGLAAHFDEGRIEVSASWHKRLEQHPAER